MKIESTIDFSPQDYKCNCIKRNQQKLTPYKCPKHDVFDYIKLVKTDIFSV